MPEQTPKRAWGHGLATVTDDGCVLDTWYPSPALGSPTGDPVPRGPRRTRGQAPGPPRAHRGGDHGDRAGESSRGRGRHVPAPAPAQPPPGAAARTQPGGHLRPAGQRRVDQPRAVRRCRVRGAARHPARQRSGAGLRRRQVPADDRLRRADRCPHRRRRPGSARRPPRRGHHRDARGLRQLQRRHPRRLDGRGPDQRRRRGRRRQRRGRGRVDHGHPLRRRQGGDHRRRALPDRGERRDRHLPG